MDAILLPVSASSNLHAVSANGMDASAKDCTQLLLDARSGDRGALDQLWSLVYDELRKIARGRLQAQPADRSLNTTALVHEAYLKLVDSTKVGWSDRAHFLALASRAMRFILIDYVRSRVAQRRGGSGRPIQIDMVQVASEDRSEDLISLDLALKTLTERDERLGTLVELRFFGGLTYEEIAEVTGRSVPTVKRDWSRARTWLFQTMRDTTEKDP